MLRGRTFRFRCLGVEGLLGVRALGSGKASGQENLMSPSLESTS